MPRQINCLHLTIRMKPYENERARHYADADGLTCILPTLVSLGPPIMRTKQITREAMQNLKPSHRCMASTWNSSFQQRSLIPQTNHQSAIHARNIPNTHSVRDITRPHRAPKSMGTTLNMFWNTLGTHSQRACYLLPDALTSVVLALINRPVLTLISLHL